MSYGTNYQEAERMRNVSTDRLIHSVSSGYDLKVILTWLREQADHKDIRFADARGTRCATLLHLANDLEERAPF